MHDTLHQPPPASSCAGFRSHLDDVVAEEADAVTLARVEAHAAVCVGCRMALAAARAYRRAMRRVGEAARASATLRERVLGTLREVRGSRQP